MSHGFKIIKTITIPGQLISKKNNHVAVARGKYPVITHKPPWQVYEKQAFKFLKSVEIIPVHHFDNGPLYMHIWHYRRTRAKFDYSNMMGGVEDVLQGDKKEGDLRHRVIPDDSFNFIIPVCESPMAGWSVSKENPRTVVSFTSDPWYLETEHLTKRGIMALIENMS